MPTVTFQPRYRLPNTLNPDLRELRAIIFGRGKEFGEAMLVYEAAQGTVQLIFIFHDDHGYYLKYRNQERKEWLSLGDRSRLDEVVTPDDWEASIGLFVPVAQAWLAIKEFCESGERTADISWIRPTDVPKGGNW